MSRSIGQMTLNFQISVLSSILYTSITCAWLTLKNLFCLEEINNLGHRVELSLDSKEKFKTFGH